MVTGRKGRWILDTLQKASNIKVPQEFLGICQPLQYIGQLWLNRSLMPMYWLRISWAVGPTPRGVHLEAQLLARKASECGRLGIRLQVVLSPADKPVMVMKILFSTRRVHAASTREHELNVSLFQIGGFWGFSSFAAFTDAGERDTHTHTPIWSNMFNMCIHEY